MKHRIAPIFPFVLFSGLTVIDKTTKVSQARVWTDEIEAFYNKHFDTPKSTWTWEDVHERDRDALIELEEVIGCSDWLPIDLELVSSFRTPEWRHSYLTQLLSTYEGMSSLPETVSANKPREDQIQWEFANKIKPDSSDLFSENSAASYFEWLKSNCINN